MYTRTTITSVLVCGLAASACGSDDPEPLAKPEFIAQANAICEATNEELAAVFEEIWAVADDVDLDDPDNELLMFSRWDAAMDEVVPIVDGQLDDIRALAPPAGDEELIETLLVDQGTAVAEFAGLMEAAANGDESAMAALEADDPFAEINQRARAYGLTACGEE